MIAIVDTGGANIASITNAFTRFDKKAVLTSYPAVIQGAERVILPGVGAADTSMERLIGFELVEVLRGLKQPCLGICLGMQLLFEHSGEGDRPCLGILPGHVTRMKASADVIIPHMGWNQLTKLNDNNPLFKGIDDGSYVYFVHSFAVPQGPWVNYNVSHGEDIPAAVMKDNFFGVQFHPEKSGPIGAKILGNFLNL